MAVSLKAQLVELDGQRAMHVRLRLVEGPSIMSYILTTDIDIVNTLFTGEPTEDEPHGTAHSQSATTVRHER